MIVMQFFQLMKLFVSKCNLDLLVEILPFDMIFIAFSVKYVTVYVMIKNVSP